MPVDPTKPLSTRPRRRREVEDFEAESSHTRETELKRARGEVSCAECRRLKIKCDKKVPCQSCIRRGCAALCPNGSLTTGEGTRFVLAATEHLHGKIAKMRERMRLLEDALATLQAQSSTDEHPLLAIKDEDVDAELGAEDGETPMNRPPPDPLEYFGTLSIREDGSSRFFGPSGGSESLLSAEKDSSTSGSPNLSARDSLSPGDADQLHRFSKMFPFTPLGPEPAVKELIRGHLPTWEAALTLGQNYVESAAWLFRGLTVTQLMNDLLPGVYRRVPPVAGFDYADCAHALALLFNIFAIATILDFARADRVTAADHFNQISCAALSLRSIFDGPSIVTVQALQIAFAYTGIRGGDAMDRDNTMEVSWSYITLAAQVSQIIGLHRDAERWGLSPKMVEWRRVLFWEIFVHDAWTCLSTGRPPVFSLPYIDCRFPVDDTPAPDGKADSEFENVSFRFASDVIADIARRTLTAEPPTYATIMDLDRKVRDFPLPIPPPSAETPVSPADPADKPSVSMQKFVLAHVRETLLLYIHRAFFAQAIIDYPDNPLKSPYAHSFLTAIRSGQTILHLIRDQLALHPELCASFWQSWTCAFSAAVVFGTIVTRGPKSPLAPTAITELNQACELFAKAAKYGGRAVKALPILLKLREKAHGALNAARLEPDSSVNAGAQWKVSADDEYDELYIFSGRTRVLGARRKPAAQPEQHPIAAEMVASTSMAAQVPTHPLYSDPPPPSHTDHAPYPQHQPHLHNHAQDPNLRPPAQHFDPRNHYGPGPSRMHAMPPVPPIDTRHLASASEGSATHSAYPMLERTPSFQWQDSAHSSAIDTYAPPPPWSSAHRAPRSAIEPHHLAGPYQHSPPGSSGGASASHYPGGREYAEQPRAYAYARDVSADGFAHHAPPSSNAHVASMHPLGATPHNELLADLGLAAPNSRLDERWSSFMRDSGYFDGVAYRR